MDTHEHQHVGGGHAHGFGGARGLAAALVLSAAFTVIEVIVGFTSGSLALIADAGHNFSDVLALGLALGAVWLAARPATANRSFGYKRADILAALAKAVTLVVIAVLIFVEAVRRFSTPPDVPGIDLIIVAAIGLATNSVGAALVVRRGGVNLNLRELEKLLHDRFAIEHTTLQVDHAAEAALLKVGRSNDRTLPAS